MDLVHLDALCSDLTVAAKTLKALCDNSGTNSPASSNGSAKDLLVATANSEDLNPEISLARSNLCGIANRLQTLLAGPTCFIRRIATQNQLLACLRWLGEFQVIAYIPLNDSISFEELAALADVSEYTLSRVVRMMATAGFLHEPQVGYVAHTPLSLSFTNDLNHFDAVMFLANKVAPSALDMIQFTQDTSGVLNVAGIQSRNFATDLAREPQLNRQWLAYRHSVGTIENDLGALLGLLNWRSLGDANVVHICDRYTTSSHTLAHISQGLNITVQAYDSTGADSPLNGQGVTDMTLSGNHRVMLQRRKPSTPQPIKDAAVYILQPSFTAMSTSSYSPHELLAVELRSHFEILRSNTTALLILAPTMLPEPGSVSVNLEVQARLLDFAEMQFNSKSAVEVTELFKMTESICDAQGRLMVTNRLRSADGATVALAVKYQPFKELDEFVWS